MSTWQQSSLSDRVPSQRSGPFRFGPRALASAAALLLGLGLLSGPGVQAKSGPAILHDGQAGLDSPTAGLSLGDRVFRDLDNDGLFEPGDGETGINVVLVSLYQDSDFSGDLNAGDAFVASTNTAGGGLYQFAGLADGDYIVQVHPDNFAFAGGLVGWSSSTGNDLIDGSAPDPDDDLNGDDNGYSGYPLADGGVASKAITLGTGNEPADDGDSDSNTNLSLDFGFARQLSIGNLVFKDLDNDGLYEPGDGEFGIDGVLVNLYSDLDASGDLSPGDGSAIASDTTAGGGLYSFTVLTPGDYVVEVDASNFEFDGPLEGMPTSTGNDPAPDPDNDVDNDDNGSAQAGGSVAAQALGLDIGAEPDKPVDGDGIDGNLTVDFGFTGGPPARLTLGDRIFKDLDNDGLYEPGDGEFGLAVVKLNLYRDSDLSGDLTAGDLLLDSTNSVAGGLYQFVDLPAGEYIVQVDAINFGVSGTLNGMPTSTGNDLGDATAPDPDNNLNADDNGYSGYPLADGGVASKAISLAPGGEPVNDGDADSDTNLSLDFGFTPTLKIGNLVFKDLDNDGLYEPGDGEFGIDEVLVNLYIDRDGSGTLTAGDGPPVDSQTTSGGGLFEFTTYGEGDYIIEADASNFLEGGALAGMPTSTGNDVMPGMAPDPDDDIDNDDNGSEHAGGGVATKAVTIKAGGEPDKTDDGDGIDGNLTVDLGFINLNPAIEIQKTVYAGHDAGAGCPGGETVMDFTSTPITYCFAVTNTGDTDLDEVTISDPDLGITEADMTLLVGGQPLTPTATLVFFYETLITDSLVNTATASGNPVDEQGRDIPDVEDPSDEDTAEVIEVDPGIPAILTDKTVYPGHDAGAGCPGTAFLETTLGRQVTYCFEVTNLGDTYLSTIAIVDPALGITEADMVKLSGPAILAPGDSVVYYYETTVSEDLVNTATSTGNPTDEEGDDIPDVEDPEDEDMAEVVTRSPEVRLQKTVYAGHDAGAGCPGIESLLGMIGDDITYCFQVNNSGDTYLGNIAISDPALGITEADMTLLSGSQPIAPGNSLTFYYQTTITGNLVNTAKSTANPTDPNGNDIPDLPDAEDEDDAEVSEIDVFVDGDNNLGDRVFKDLNDNGIFEPGAGEFGIGGVLLRIWFDLDTSGDLSAGDLAGPTATTDPSGFYAFGTLASGDFIVEIDASNFAAGGALEDMPSSEGNDEPDGTAPDPDDDVDGDDNGYSVPGFGVASKAITLISGLEPTDDGDDANGNLTLDFGFINPPTMPGISLDKTVYLGHDNGVECPGMDVLWVVSGMDITYCFAVSNTGDTYLNGISVDDPDLGITEADMSIVSGAEPLAPGDTIVFYYETAMAGNLVNTATATGNPTDAQGDDIPGLGDPSDSDTAEVEQVFKPASLCLGGQVFKDLDNDGLFEPGDGEFVISLVKVNLYKEIDANGKLSAGDMFVGFSSTDANGRYSFCGLVEGEYIAELDPLNFMPGGRLVGMPTSRGNDLPDGTAPDPDDNVDQDDNGYDLPGYGVATKPITLFAGTEPPVGADGDDTDGNQTLDFGVRCPLCLGDLVFKDMDEDGRYEPVDGDAGIDGVLVVLWRDSDGTGNLTAGDTRLGSMLTADGGSYLFCDLANGEYIVEIDATNFAAGGPLEGYDSSTGNDVGGMAPDPDDDVDNDDNGTPVPGFGVASKAVRLGCGSEPDKPVDGDGINSNRTIDFGFACPADLCLGDTVFFDIDNDGLYEPGDGEFAIPGVALALYADTDASGGLTAGDVLLAETSTDVNGRYEFCGLAPGEYIVLAKPSNFDSGAVLENTESSTGNDVLGAAPDPDDDVDNDDNGGVVPGFGVATSAITLSRHGEPDVAADGDHDNKNSTLDLGFKQVEPPTGVQMGGLTAEIDASGKVSLRWWTLRETGLVGFRVLRAPTRSGNYELVSPSIIPAGDARDGARYAFEDQTAGGHWFYLLELVGEDGETSRFGPVRASLDQRPAWAVRIFLPSLFQAAAIR